jgi:hydroxyacylglutathione hydrolase
VSAKLQIVPVECLKDNLSYLILNSANDTAIAVDPGEAQPFFRTLDLLWESSGERYTIAAAVTTHHHYDHVDGLPDFPDVPTWSSVRDRERIPAAGTGGPKFSFVRDRKYTWSELTHPESHSSPKENSGGELEIDAFEIPGHTQGQIALRVRGIGKISHLEESHLFVGDTLFSLGCGRCLEGTPDQLFQSLQKIKNLPAETILHFGHEYTKRNVGFWRKAISETPERCHSILNADDLTRFENLVESKEFRFRKAPTLGEEAGTNPFLKIKSVAEFSEWRAKRDVY